MPTSSSSTRQGSRANVSHKLSDNTDNKRIKTDAPKVPTSTMEGSLAEAQITVIDKRLTEIQAQREKLQQESSQLVERREHHLNFVKLAQNVEQSYAQNSEVIDEYVKVSAKLMHSTYKFMENTEKFKKFAQTGSITALIGSRPTLFSPTFAANKTLYGQKNLELLATHNKLSKVLSGDKETTTLPTSISSVKKSAAKNKQ